MVSMAVPARIEVIATHLPDSVLTNEALASQFPDWPAEKILQKTGIRERRIASPDETASDLAYYAAQKLFEQSRFVPGDIDFLILCTQAPDFFLPTSACLLQERLGLRKDVGAFDINLGCSGFVYGLSVAVGMIAAGIASNVLLLTADTYSKFINERDKSVRTLFGDAAAATLVSGGEDGNGTIGPFVFGTDGAGARDLIVETGAFRTPRSSTTSLEKVDAMGNRRSRDDLYMNGGNILNFGLREVPKTYKSLLERSRLAPEDIDHVILHQANKFMLDALQKKLQVPDDKFFRYYEDVGNTVSSTIPFVMADLLNSNQFAYGSRSLLIGFGVGLSWAGAVIQW